MVLMDWLPGELLLIGEPKPLDPIVNWNASMTAAGINWPPEKHAVTQYIHPHGCLKVIDTLRDR